jgi:simple sugar transport system permease protein
MEYIDFIFLTLGASMRVATPLLLAALAGLYCERSGILDLGLEGKMLVGAFAAAVATGSTGSAVFGLLMAIALSCGFAMLHGYACITHKGNQVVSGVAINIVASGLTGLLAVAWFSTGSRTTAVLEEDRLSPIILPGVEALADIPVLGSVYGGFLSGHNILTWLALLLVPATWFVLARTTFGLRLRSVGENPAAVETAGISVSRVQYSAMIVSGTLCGLAGAYLSIGQGAGFVSDMTAGKGFIALAAVIFGKWRPVPTMFACLLFGLFDAVAARMQGSALAGALPAEFIQALPYLLTVVVLALFVGKAVAPKALGRPYLKEQ